MYAIRSFACCFVSDDQGDLRLDPRFDKIDGRSPGMDLHPRICCRGGSAPAHPGKSPSYPAGRCRILSAGPPPGHFSPSHTRPASPLNSFRILNRLYSSRTGSPEMSLRTSKYAFSSTTTWIVTRPLARLSSSAISFFTARSPSGTVSFGNNFHLNRTFLKAFPPPRSCPP